MVHSASCEPQTPITMLQQTTPQPNQIVQYVIGRDDLEEILNGIVDNRMSQFYERKKAEANADKLLSPKEVAELLDVDLSTLWRWNNEGYLTKVYIGNKPRYRQSDIDRILMKGGEK